ncbi:MAG TPA: hypothetical protein VIG48_09350 [Jatrophihabitans sp.]
MEQPYEAPAPFAPPSLRSAPLNEQAVYGRSTYPHSPMVPVPVAPPPPAPGQWQPGVGWVPAGHRTRSAARRRTIAMVAAVSLALVAVIGALAIGRAGPTGHSLSLPESAGSYVRISALSSDHIRSIFGSTGAFGAIPAADLGKARIGIYGRGGQSAPSALFIGFSAADSPNIGRQLHVEAADQVTSDVLTSAGAATGVAVDAGPLGGSLRCGRAHVDGLFAEVGVWADGDTLGLVLLFDPALSPSTAQTGAVTRAFRAEAEH